MIFLYSKTWEDHLIHLAAVLEKLSAHTHFPKKSKCTFGCKEIEYLGHLVSAKGVKADPSKIGSMVNWPLPHSLKSLRGFLGFTGYYKKFMRNNGVIAAPLTALFKKNAFQIPLDSCSI